MSGGIDPGCVRLRLDSAGGRISTASVTSERPAVAQALRGRPGDDAVRLVPLLFALCGKAQGRAAELALAAARGRECAAHIDAAIQAEVMREHLWRWLIDLPPLMGGHALQAEFRAAAACIAAGMRADLAELLTAPCFADLSHRLNAITAAVDLSSRMLPMLDAQSSLAAWSQFDAGFCREPHWSGRAAETGALARRQGKAAMVETSIAARWLARLEELRDWAGCREKVGAGGTASAVQAGPGRGRSLAETSRGLLMHEIALDGDRIADYFIVAPTEWNFHPHGTLAHWLIGRDSGDREALQGFAAHAVAALDPCVRWELEWL